MDDKVRERFWIKVNKTEGCWLWIASKDRKGYGKLGINNRIYSAHRLAWEDCYGPIPPGLFICHHCDVPACVRPDHLFLGTCSDNLRDMVAKGRHARALRPEDTPRGEKHGSAKVTEQQVLNIVELRKAGWTYKKVAEFTGISLSTVTSILRGVTWAASTGLEKDRGHPKGEKHGNTKFTNNQILEIVSLCHSGVTQTEVARKFGVDQCTINHIMTGTTWGWLTGIKESRGIRGSNNHNTTLDNEKVLEIVALHNSGLSRSAIVKAVGVTRHSVGSIVTGRTWSWLTGIEKPLIKEKSDE